jgi:uncharacterized protein (DUF4213/DUF364 family)
MKLLHDLLASINQNAPVRSVLVGAHWTLVCSRYCGLASTLTGDKPHGHDKVREVGSLLHKSAQELGEFALSENLLEASIGMAAINSLIDVDERLAEELNAADFLIERGEGKNVALVGHFPFIPRLRPVARRLWVIEQNPTGDEYPAEAADELIPQADVVAITSTALVNHTAERLLALCQPNSLVMLLGPTTPLSPILFDHGVTILSGTQVVDESAAQRTIEQGATFQQMEGVKLLTIINQKETS